MTNWFAQSKIMDCFPVAAMNFCRYLSMRIPDRQNLVKIAKCEDGATIHPDAVLKACGLYLVKCGSEDIIREQKFGIITIMHPKHNLHAVFYFERDGKHFLVNSLIEGKENCDEFVLEEILDLMPRHEQHRKGYSLPVVRLNTATTRAVNMNKT